MGRDILPSLGYGRWETLYASHAAQVFAYASRRVGVDDAADVVADTFLVAWRRLGDVPDDALPWLYAAARNVVNNARRAEDPEGRVAIATGRGGVACDPRRSRSGGGGGAADILAAMRLLPAPEREALMLVAWEELEPRRAAAVMGCTPGTFAVRVHRGRRHLKKISSLRVRSMPRRRTSG